ncbi:MAG: DUF4388 domain-containing protein [Acidobacteria bacterium]|nr:DUF4388 domain-containing protein [Acidobacteriota bacterium]
MMNKEKFFPQLLGQCYKSCRSGILTIKLASTIKTIHFDIGDIVYATSNIAGERLADNLLEKGILTTESLKQATELSEQYQMRLVEILIKMNFVPESTLREIARQQVVEIVYNTFSWVDFTAEFDYCRPSHYDFNFALPTPQIILEGIKQLNNLPLIKQLIEDLNSPLQFIDDPQLLPHILALQPEENKIISYLKSGYTTTQLIDNKLMAEETLVKIIAALLISGILKLGKEQINPLYFSNTEKLVDTKSVIEFCYEVESKINAIKKGASHYEILETKANASSTELIMAYTELIKRFHPDHQVTLSSYGLNIRNELEFIFNKLTETVQVMVENKPLEKQPSLTNKPSINSTSPNKFSTSENNYTQIMEFCYKVENKLSSIRKGDSYYQILELDRDATTEAIIEAYHCLSDYFSSKKQDELAKYSINMRDELNKIASSLTKAFDVLKNSYQRQSYNQQLGKHLVRHAVTQQAFNPSNIENQTQFSDKKNFLQPSKSSSNLQTSSQFNSNLPKQPLNTSSGITQSFEAENKHSGINRSEFLSSTAIDNTLGKKPNTPQANTRPNPPLSASIYAPQSQMTSRTSNSQLKATPPTANPLSTNLSRTVEPPPGNPNYIQQKNLKMMEDESVKYQLPKASHSSALVDPNRAPTAVDFYVRGTQFYNERQYDKAVTFLRKAVALSPDSGEYWLQLGKVYSKMSGYEKQAEAAYLEAADLIPDDVETRISLGILYQKCGLPESATEMFESVLEIDPNNIVAKQALSNVPQSERKLFNFLAKIGLVNPK